MITNKGKNILAKYLIGQAPAYASYLAFGCGPTAITTGSVFSTAQQDAFAQKTALDFEMFRAPIISRGYVNENVLNSDGDIELDENGDPIQISQIVFTAELPTDERYEITEIGVYSGGSNPSAGAYDSKVLTTFAESENWEYHYKNDPLLVNETRYPARKIDVISGSDVEQPGVSGAIKSTLDVFRVNADNPIFNNNDRVFRNERCRFLNSMLLMRGNSSSILGNSEEDLAIDIDDNSHIHLNGLAFNLDRNASPDEIKIAFSVINAGAASESPGSVKIIIDFATPETEDGVSQQYARFKVYQDNISDNRYFVKTKSLQELEKTSGFSWSAVRVVKIYAAVYTSAGTRSSDYYVALDAIRLDNITTLNPLYGLTAYSVVKNEDGLPIIKNLNSSTLAEFRFGIDVLGGI